MTWVRSLVVALAAAALSACGATSVRPIDPGYRGTLEPVAPLEPAPASGAPASGAPASAAPVGARPATLRTLALLQESPGSDAADPADATPAETTVESGADASETATAPAPSAAPAAGGTEERIPDDGERKVYKQANWGLAGLLRTADIPYPAESNRVSSFVPMLFYEGERFFWRGLAGGLHLFHQGALELNLLGRIRFFDIPAEFQNAVQGDALEAGLQARYDVGRAWWEAEALSDRFGNWTAIGRVGASYVSDRWVVQPSIDLRYGSEGYVSRYYGLDPFTGIQANGDVILTPTLTARFRIVSDFYALGSVGYHAFGDEIRGLSTIDEPGAWETFVGIGFFQDFGAPQFLGRPRDTSGSAGRDIDIVPHLRLAHAFGTPSAMSDIFTGNVEDDPFNNQLTSLFYGYPLTDRLFGLPLDFYLVPGFAYHYPSDVQGESYELILKIHIYYTFKLPVRIRFGVAEGVSWIDEPTYIETTALAEDGYETSDLMNYLDFTLDFNVGDLFRSKSLEPLWAGVTLHHRSSIFESAAQFGRIKGGSNYIGVYLQWDLF
ncbi:MAG: MipA/OmpV family protein [Planctomycetota bacterium]